MTPTVLAFGEALYDIYPTHKKIGGAPLNFAAHFARLGGKSFIYTAVGKDDNGRDILEEISALGVDTSLISILDGVPTGFCKVGYKGDEPSYELAEGVSYDYIPPLGEPPEVDLFYFGTLALRSEKSRGSFLKLDREIVARLRFLDLNLRGDFYTESLIRELLCLADAVKLNREEYLFCAEMLGLPSEISSFCRALASVFRLKLVIVTLDKDGAVAYDAAREEYIESPIIKAPFVSAVGAGDSFSACFAYCYLNGMSLSECMTRARRLSSFVVGREEAVPDYSPKAILG